MKSWLLPGLTSVFVALLSTTSDAATDMPDCTGFKTRAVLLVDYEYCAHATAKSANAGADDFADAHANSLYIARWIDIPEKPDARLKSRALKILAPKPDEFVAIISKDKLPWATKPDPKTQNVGGGGFKGAAIALCVTGKIVNGHYEITRKAMENSLLAGPGLDFVASASRDADDFEWNLPRAHAQTGNATDLTPLDVQIAKSQFHDWIDLNAKRAQAACPAKPIEAGYVLGYLFHAVQDLSTHGGITNAEHSYLSHTNQNPDGNRALIQRSKEWSKRMLDTLRPKLGESCLSAIAALPSNTKRPAVAKTYFGEKDGTLRALWQYRGLGALFEKSTKPRHELQVSWFTGTTADAFFKTNVLDVISALSSK